MANLIVAAVLFAPLSTLCRCSLGRVSSAVSIALLYYDSWLPTILRLKRTSVLVLMCLCYLEIMHMLVPATDVDNYLGSFHKNEEQRQNTFKTPAPDATPFNLVMIHICSMSWADIDDIGLREHTLFGEMDILFDNFNSATS